jgi:TldD protein
MPTALAQVPPMISREPTLERLAIAQALLLEPFGLDEATLTRALATIATHRIDDADLYFQTRAARAGAWKKASSRAAASASTRAWACARWPARRPPSPTPTTSPRPALLDAARTVRTIAAAGQSKRVKVAARRRSRQPRAVRADGPDRHAGQHAEGGAAGKVEKLARAKDPRVVQVMAGLAGEYDVVLVARADGTLAADVRPLVRLS